MKMIFIFIDGFGLGKDDMKINPFYAAGLHNIHHILNDYKMMPTDATLGVEGLPQSATGQTAIFTGANAAAILGRHLSGQPTETLKKVINKNNIFLELIRRGYRVANSNVYRQEYLNKILDPKDRRHRPSVSSVMTLSAGIGFRTVDDFKAGKGIYHDITGHTLRDGGYDVEIISPAEAAGRLFKISRDYDFTLFEYFLTDIIGHTMDMNLAVEEIRKLDSFLGELLRIVDTDEDIIFITSDHGNIEDLSIKTHTMNKVPTVIVGRRREDQLVRIESLVDIMPAVLEIFNIQEKGTVNE